MQICLIFILLFLFFLFFLKRFPVRIGSLPDRNKTFPVWNSVFHMNNTGLLRRNSVLPKRAGVSRENICYPTESLFLWRNTITIMLLRRSGCLLWKQFEKSPLKAVFLPSYSKITSRRRKNQCLFVYVCTCFGPKSSKNRVFNYEFSLRSKGKERKRSSLAA